MQSEELEEPPGKPTMTFLQESCPIQPEPKTNHFEGINLEDDIEKVEVTSETSNESPVPEMEPLPKLFSDIPDQNPDESIKNWLQRINDFKKLPEPTPSRVVKFQDLPYMGEMTLDNSKPRRGRKPKKADICHLIYKNYGTIFPGTPNAKNYTDAKKEKEDVRSDVQNRIISSLLERRLTQEYKRKSDKTETLKSKNQSEPLNLCIRDLNHLKIRLMKKDNTYCSEVKTEPTSDEDEAAKPVEFPATPDSLSSSSNEVSKTPEAPNYVYWPNAGVFIHPMALQQQLMLYQRLANNSAPLPSTKAEKPEELRKLVPKTPLAKNEDDTEVKNKRLAQTPEKTPAKRKRSAIFIPPIPTENNSNPATEVSICKFKFTGGAKPSLQEKKMLSVDSGGNFRYYSGTGDKSMRGYEFFPRETLQQQVSNSQGSSTGAFLQASGEKIYPVPPVDFPGKSSSEFLLSPELPSSSQEQKLKKRKSRKSLQREKLEQTFKEKGFLIQTQQLESAEGATYCKFRQLRKFTRYLFRSWKDYLPGNVRELQEGEREAGELEAAEVDAVSVHSELSNNTQ